MPQGYESIINTKKILYYSRKDTKGELQKPGDGKQDKNYF